MRMLALLLPLFAASTTPTGPPSHALHRGVSPHAVIAPPGYAPGVPLPDTVLARINGNVDIGAAAFAAAVRRLGGRPDSLTPADRRRFLDLLIEQRVLALRAARERWTWTPQESLQFAYQRDRLIVNAALDSALRAAADARRARGDSALDAAALGVALRDSAAARLAPVWDQALLARLAAAFDSLPRPGARQSVSEQLRAAGEMPRLAPADTEATIARTADGPYTVAELLAAWRRLNPIYRPRISTPEQVRDLVRNGLFERMLRRAAARQGLERRPDVAAALAERSEYAAVQHLVAREVYAKIAEDSLTLLRHFRAHLGDWDLPARATVVSVTLGDRAAAGDLMRRFTVPGEAESLAARSGRSGVPYASLVTAESDSELFHAATRGGAGATLGPDSTADGWRVAHVLALEPARHRTFAEARALVQRDWYNREGERLMRSLVEGLRRSARVRVNERWLARGLPAARPRP